MRMSALALVALAAVCAGCSSREPAATASEVTFQAHALGGRGPVTARALERTIVVLRSRARRMGIREPTIRRAGRNRIAMHLPGVRDERRAARRIAATGRLRFLDWEANVLDAGCRTHPARVNGGQRSIDGRRARERASRCRRELGSGVFALRERAGHWWAVEDDTFLDGDAIERAEQDFDEAVGGEPVVVIELSRRGRRALARATRQIARRGAENAARHGGSPVPASHHFAVRLDDELLATPYVNFREHPDGIDARSLQIAGGFTIQEAKELAALVAGPALPLRLELVAGP